MLCWPQVQGVKDTIKTMTASGPYIPTTGDKISASNDSYLGSEMQKQEQMMRQVYRFMYVKLSALKDFEQF